MRLRIHPRFCIILIAMMLVVFSVSIGLSFRDLHAGKQRLAEVRNEYSALQRELASLREELEYAQTDDYVEQVARKELGLMKPGEIRYVGAR
jgi:cell division protein FtsB